MENVGTDGPVGWSCPGSSEGLRHGLGAGKVVLQVPRPKRGQAVAIDLTGRFASGTPSLWPARRRGSNPGVHEVSFVTNPSKGTLVTGEHQCSISRRGGCR
jgi:hypothetical protein